MTARRLPAARPGKGGAARYVSGKMPINARGVSRNEQAVPNQSNPGASHTVNSSVLELNNAQTEEDIKLTVASAYTGTYFVVWLYARSFI